MSSRAGRLSNGKTGRAVTWQLTGDYTWSDPVLHVPMAPNLASMLSVWRLAVLPKHHVGWKLLRSRMAGVQTNDAGGLVVRV